MEATAEKTDAHQTFDDVVDPEFDATAPSEAKPFTIWTISKFRLVGRASRFEYSRRRPSSERRACRGRWAGGVGKSRYALQLAICQSLGIPFVSLDTHGKPQRWLFIGNENSISRMKTDLDAMLSQYTDEQIAILEKHIFMQALVDTEDYFISLGDEEVEARWVQTLLEIRPTVLVADPFGNILDGDMLKDADVEANDCRVDQNRTGRQSPDGHRYSAPRAHGSSEHPAGRWLGQRQLPDRQQGTVFRCADRDQLGPRR